MLFFVGFFTRLDKLLISHFFVNKYFQFQDASTESVPDVIKKKLAPETSVLPQQSSFSCVTGQNSRKIGIPKRKM